MTTGEYSSQSSEAVVTRQSRLASCLAPIVILLSAFCVVLSACMAWLSFTRIAAAEDIIDARAGQVTLFFAVLLGLAWCVGVVFFFTRKASEETQPSLAHALHSSPRALGLAAASIGTLVATAISGGVLVALARLPMVVVTPPAGWLVTLTASGLGSVLALRVAPRIVARWRGAPR